MNGCIICVDGGGTKTEVVAYTLSGTPITSYIGGSGNFAFQADVAVENVYDSVNTVYERIKGKYIIQMIQMGISGYGAYDAKEQLIERFETSFQTAVSIVDDAKLALYSLVKDQYHEGVLILAGTGSACYGMKDDETLLIGGWGHLLGDEGSAHHLVLETFRMMIRDEDEGKAHRMLSKKVLEHLGLNSTFELKKYVYSRTKSEIAALARFVNDCAEAGDVDAITLLKQAGEALGRHVILAFQRLNLNPNAIIGYQGSFVRNSTFVKEALKAFVHRDYPEAQFVEIDERPIRGAYYLGLRTLRQGEQK